MQSAGSVFRLIVSIIFVTVLFLTFFIWKLSPVIKTPQHSIVTAEVELEHAKVAEADEKPHEYFEFRTVLENASLCEDDPQIVLSVFTAPTDFHGRATLRRLWAHNLLFKGVKLRVVFPIGRTDTWQNQSDIERESRTFGDILQQDYIDSYHNLSLKRLASIDWQLRRCANAHWTVKADDDVFVNTHRLIEFYLYYRQHNLSGFFCFTNYGAEPMRAGKWRVTKEEFPGNKYPPYCIGFMTVCSLSDSRRLLEAARTSKFLWIEDVFIGGLLRAAARVELHSFLSSEGFGARWGLKENARVTNVERYIVFDCVQHRKIQSVWKMLRQNINKFYQL